MYQKFAFLSIACFISLFTAAQLTKPIGTRDGRPVYNFTAVNPKLQYVFIEDKPGNEHPHVGDDVMLRMIGICNNRFLYNSGQLNKGKPAPFTLSEPGFKGDIFDALVLMTPGDSVICLVDAEALYGHLNKKMPDFIKPGDLIQYNIRLVSIKRKEELEKERQEAIRKATQEEQKQTADTIKQKPGKNK